METVTSTKSPRTATTGSWMRFFTKMHRMTIQTALSRIARGTAISEDTAPKAWSNLVVMIMIRNGDEPTVKTIIIVLPWAHHRHTSTSTSINVSINSSDY